LGDTTARERFKPIVKLYYKYSHVVIVLFSIDDPKSLQEVPKFMREFQEAF